MREILGRRRAPWAWRPGRKTARSPMRAAALTCATRWRWPVVPGAPLASAPELHTGGPRANRRFRKGSSAGTRSGVVLGPDTAGCSCADPDCAVPGAHPADPVLLAATTNARMVDWWWTNRPAAPVILATGGSAPCALSLPAVAGARALAGLDRLGVRTGPVVATPTRFSLLVAPYSLEELGDLLCTYDWVPSSLRFHSAGGYVALPPSRTGPGQLRWERQPVVDRGTDGVPWLPRLEMLLDLLVEASSALPDPETLTY